MSLAPSREPGICLILLKHFAENIPKYLRPLRSKEENHSFSNTLIDRSLVACGSSLRNRVLMSKVGKFFYFPLGHKEKYL